MFRVGCFSNIYIEIFHSNRDKPEKVYVVCEKKIHLSVFRAYEKKIVIHVSIPKHSNREMSA